ncbi:Immunoglobulin-like fold [Cinara cedri]|uniref:Immunoglobulin-like fold n=1 Tax=Cinara cedri TaxID=506608 RepID=A0A5E4NAH0_9HEMI|nr:Immunoglobulin-like fold [Cinara cedri]
MAVFHGLLARFALLLLLTAVCGVSSAALPPPPPPRETIAADEDLMKASPLTVAQCRAGCLHKLVPRDVEATECEKKSDCWKCWKYCEVLQMDSRNMKSICEHNCDVGCQEACSFHDWHGSSQPSPVVEARGERALTIESGTLRWPRPAQPLSPSSPRLVYVIMRRREPGTRRTWSQLGQTPGYKARLPKTTVAATVRVLAVSAEGLVTIYSPAPEAAPAPATAVQQIPSTAAAASVKTAATPLSAASPSAAPLHDLRDADIIIKSLGRDQILGIRLPLTARSAPQEESLRLMGDDPSGSSEVWNLREVSMIHQKVLVIAEVAWDARQVHRPAYLVTWEIVGGGLKGNLFTDTTCVTLSLWPDTAYLIQVSLLGGADDSVKMSTSPTLLLDTRSAVHSTPAAVFEVTTAARPAGPAAANTAAPSETVATDEVADATFRDYTTDSDTAPEDTTAAITTFTASATVITVPGRWGSSADADDDDETVAAVAGMEDVTAELSAPVVVAAGLGHTQWQLLTAVGASVALFLLLALVLAYRRTGGRGSPALHKVIQHDDAECPPLLDYAPRSLDFAKYLGRCRRSHQLLDEEAVTSHREPRVTRIRH